MNSKKNILFFIGANYVSGAEITNLNLLRDLQSKGYHILVIVSGWNDGDFIDRLKKLGIKYKVVKLGFIYRSKWKWTIDSLMHLPIAWLEIYKVIKKFKPDWIYHASYRSFIMAYPLIRSYRNIYREHNNPDVSRSNLKIYNFLNRHIKLFLCNSSSVKETLAKVGISSKKIHAIGSPIDPEILNKKTDSALNHPIHIGIIGQIIKEKGFDFVFDELTKVNGEYKLFIYGNDNTEYAKNLRVNIPTNLTKVVHWMGYESDRKKIYDNLDVILYPSYSEGFGRVAMEAASNGIPTVASNLPCFLEVIKHEVSGKIFDLKTKKNLVKDLEDLINEPSKIKILGTEARTIALNNFSSEMCTNRFIDLIYE